MSGWWATAAFGMRQRGMDKVEGISFLTFVHAASEAEAIGKVYESLPDKFEGVATKVYALPCPDEVPDGN